MSTEGQEVSAEGQEKSKGGQEQSVNKKKGKGGLIAVICVSVAVIAVMAGVIVYLLNRDKGGNEAEELDTSRGVVVNEENVDEVLENLTDPTPPGMYEVVMNSRWDFPSGKEASTDAYVENSTRNSQAVYFDVKLQDTGETIFESPILPVGTHLNSKDIKLDKELPAGVYDCLLTYHLVDENENETSTVKLTLVINISK